MASPLRIGELSVDYDQAGDVLYVSLGDPKPALTFEERDGLLVWKDPVSGVPIAVTVIQYEGHFRKLDDVSWVGESHLPEGLTNFLLYWPSFISL
jgi:hypothetical protein